MASNGTLPIPAHHVPATNGHRNYPIMDKSEYLEGCMKFASGLLRFIFSLYNLDGCNLAHTISAFFNPPQAAFVRHFLALSGQGWLNMHEKIMDGRPANMFTLYEQMQRLSARFVPELRMLRPLEFLQFATISALLAVTYAHQGVNNAGLYAEMTIVDACLDLIRHGRVPVVFLAPPPHPI